MKRSARWWTNRVADAALWCSIGVLAHTLYTYGREDRLDLWVFGGIAFAASIVALVTRMPKAKPGSN